MLASMPATGQVSLGGRIVGFRRMGKATFIDLLDGHGRMQVLLRRNLLTDSYETLKDLDIGDWLGVDGPLFPDQVGRDYPRGAPVDSPV